LWVFIQLNDANATVSSVMGSGGCSSAGFTILDNPTHLSADTVAQAYLENLTGGACTVTVTFSIAVQASIVATHEFSGGATSSSLSGHTAQCQTTPGNGTDAVTSGTITTTSGDYLVGGTTNGSASGASVAAGTGFASRENAGTYFGFGTEDLFPASGSPTAVTFTATGSPAVQCTVAASFKAAGGGGTRPCVIGGGISFPGCNGT
jgi:hypothetical protein